MSLRHYKLNAAKVNYGQSSRSVASVGVSAKTVGTARKRVALKRTIRRSTNGKVSPGSGASTNALKRAVKMLQR